MRITEPDRYFQEGELEESLLLRVEFNRTSQELEMVVSYANIDLLRREMAGQVARQERDSEFRRLLFRNVTSLVREKVLLKIGDPKAINYRATKGSGNQVIQGLWVKNEGSAGWSIRLSFGTFGCYSFLFQQLEVEVCFARLEQVSGDEGSWKNVQTGKPIDVFNPFADSSG